ncbi:MAG: hypothetical protein Q7S40_21005 [Opitutaceae bacterium]|nr:hypothetical protein [Opitutaceae bacterium]
MKDKSAFFNPFPGLRSFRSDEDHLFFGREQQTMELVARLQRNRFIAVVGSSGRGKSSLVRCGLLSRLQGGGMSDAGAHWAIAVMHPGGDPLRHLTEALLEAELHDRGEENAVPHLLATLGRSQFGLVEAVRQAGLPVGTNFLLVVDQFEEIFRYDEAGEAESEVANDFIAMLREATAQTEVPIYVVATMRSDFIGDCSRFEGLAEAVNRGEYLIPRLSREQFKSAIEGPIRVAGGEITPRLLQRLLNDLGEEQDQLPCLQHALMRTWRVWQGRAGAAALDLEDYAQVGKMSQALSVHADEIFFGLATERQRELCAAMFKALTVEGSEKRGIRRPRRLQALCHILGVDKAKLLPVIDAFRHPEVSFLTPPADVELRDTTVIDLSHESLMRVWARLREWVDEEAKSVGIFRRLSETAALWRQGRTGFFRDPELSIARSWMETSRPNAAWAEQHDGNFEEAVAFLEASTHAAGEETRAQEAARQRELEQARALAEAERARAEEQTRFAGKLKWLVRGMGIVAMVAVTAMIMAIASRREAQQNAELARHSEGKAQAAAKEAANARRLADVGRREAEDVMGYMLNDLREQLTDLGHGSVLLDVAQKTVAYYEHLPAALLTIDTGVAHANALANLGSVLGLRDDAQEAFKRFEESIRIFEDIERSGKLTAAMHVDYAAALAKLARYMASETRRDEALTLSERIESLLAAPLAQPELRGRALGGLAESYGNRAYVLRYRRPKETIDLYRRAIAALEEAEQLPPPPRHPGMRKAFLLAWLAGPLRQVDPDGAQHATEEAKAILEKMLAQDPALQSAKSNLTYVLGDISRQHSEEWRFAEADQARDRTRAVYADLLRLDPNNRVFLNNRAVALRSAAGDAFQRGDFSTAEKLHHQTIHELSVKQAGSFMKNNTRQTYGQLATLYAATGRDAEADEYLARMQPLATETSVGRLETPLIRSEDDVSQENRERNDNLWRTVQIARGNWASAQSDAAAALAKMDEDVAAELGDESARRRKWSVVNQLLQASSGARDYVAARRALAILDSLREPPAANPTPSQRLAYLRFELQAAHVLACSDETTAARKRLELIWPELEAVYALAPGEAFTEVEMARGLWIKAEIGDELDPDGRRTLLEHALGHVRPLAAANKLTRNQRELILAPLENQLANVAR